MALAPLLVAVGTIASGRASGMGALKQPLVLGLLTGGVYFGGTLYWLVDVMVIFGGLAPPVAILPAGLLVLYLALFPAFFAAGVWFLQRWLGLAALLLAPAVWVSAEVGRTHLWSGFPWVLLGYSQTDVLPIAQLASAFGVYGLSALVVAVNAGLALALLGRGRLRWLPALAVLACVAGIAAWGSHRLVEDRLIAEGSAVRVGLVQGNIAQDDKWNPALAARIFQRHLDLSRQAISRGATFVIWPESSTPFFFENEPAGQEAVRALAREAGVHLLIGSDQIEWPEGVTDPHEARYYNAAFLVGPDGGTEAVYRKIHLVPFGEYVPLRRLLFFVSPLVEAVSDFSPGAEPVVLPVGSHLASTAICYEVIYPLLMRRFVVDGSELLTTITNDAWYGRSSAPYQHFQQAALRSIEQGRYLARAANTGISGLVDPYGRVLARSGMFETVVLVGEARFLQHRTLYSRIGDLFAWLCLLATAGAIGVAGARRPGLRRPDWSGASVAESERPGRAGGRGADRSALEAGRRRRVGG